MREISCVFTFEAAHRLTKVPPSHKCARMHGHSFVAEVFVARVPHQEDGEHSDGVDEAGMVIDFDVIRRAWDSWRDPVDPTRHILDHNCLNDVEGLDNPTSERIAQWIYNRLTITFGEWNMHEAVYIDRVVVRETSRSSASYPR